jgi:hypothetical protein
MNLERKNYEKIKRRISTRWQQATGNPEQGPSYKQQAASCKRQAASLTRDLYCVIGYSRRKKYESK